MANFYHVLWEHFPKELEDVHHALQVSERLIELFRQLNVKETTTLKTEEDDLFAATCY